MRTITYGNNSDVGRVRSDNQDCVGKFPEDSLDLSLPMGQLFIIADGMGGHKGGREASQLAVQTIQEEYFAGSQGNIGECLRQALMSANEHIFQYSVDHPELSGMGTTCSALVLQDDHAYIAHIGDSRIYHITKKRISQLTQDHSTVAEMERRGILTKEEARYHPERSHLYRALGTRPEAEVDVLDNIDLGTNDYFLMCTDGLSNYVEEGEMQNTVLSHSPQEACEMFTAIANERGGQDNITVQVVHVSGGDSFINRIMGA